MDAEGRIEYGRLQLRCAFAVQSILDFCIIEEAGEHAKGVFRVRLEPGAAPGELLEGIRDTVVELCMAARDGQETGTGSNPAPLFSGLLEEARLSEEGGYCEAELTALSGTVLLDCRRNSRIFQNPGQKYGDVAGRILRDTEGGAYILTVQDRKTVTPFFQYRETDWEFLKRVAGRLGLELAADCGIPRPRLYMGLRRGGVQEVPEGSSIGCRFDGERYYRLLGQGACVEREDFFCFMVSTWKNMGLGERVMLEGRELSVWRKKAALRDGCVEFSYECAGPGYRRCPAADNEDLTGLELSGRVTAMEREKCELSLDAEPSQAGGFQYPYAPAAGNPMYCMPREESRVLLKLGSGKEGEGTVSCCLRTNGSECAETGVPSLRSFRTDCGKGMELYPGSLGISAEGAGSLRIGDGEGVRLTSGAGILLYAKGNILLDGGKTVDMQTVAEICAASLLSETSTLWMNSRFDFLSGRALLKGSIYVEKAPFDDDVPVKGHFNWLGFAVNLATGLVVGVGLLVLSTLTCGVAAAALVGAGISVLMATTVMEVSDYESGNVRGWDDALQTIIVAAICGAITGACSFLLEGFFVGSQVLANHPVVRKMLMEAGSGTVDVVTGLFTRASEASMDDSMTGEEKHAYIWNWDSIKLDFITGTVIDLGVGGLKLAGGKQAAKGLEDGAERAAKEAAEKTSKEAIGEGIEQAERYMDFLENGSREGLRPEELLGIQKVDDYLALEKVDYDKILDLRLAGGKYAAKESLEDGAEQATKEAERYLDFLENGSREGLRPEELLGIQKVDDYLALEKVDYDKILDLRKGADVGGLDQAIKGGSNTINPQLINSQSELSKEYFDTLQSNGTLKSGGRSGGTVPQTAPANSYYITEGGHVVIYGQDGKRVMDISSERIKIYKFNQNPNNPNLGNWSDRKLKDSNGMTDKTAQWILDYFGIT